MAYFFYSDKAPDALKAVVDTDKLKFVSTETLEEYLLTNRFSLDPNKVNIDYVIAYSLAHGYSAKVSRLYYSSIFRKNKMITVEEFLEYDGLPTTSPIMIPIVKEAVIDVFREYAEDKIQVIDVVIELQDGTKIYDYKALNAINRVQAFTWDGSMQKEDCKEGFSEHRYPSFNSIEMNPTFNFSSMKIMAYKKDLVEKEIVCRDSVADGGYIMICESLDQELKKRKFKRLRLENDDTKWMKFI